MVKRGKKIIFEVDPYHYEVIVFYCLSTRTVKKFISNFERGEELAPDECEFQVVSLTTPDKRKLSMVHIGRPVKYNPVDMGFIAHEAFHVAQFLCNACGLRVGGEATAYLVQHITQKILEGIT